MHLTVYVAVFVASTAALTIVMVSVISHLVSGPGPMPDHLLPEQEIPEAEIPDEDELPDLHPEQELDSEQGIQEPDQMQPPEEIQVSEPTLPDEVETKPEAQLPELEEAPVEEPEPATAESLPDKVEEEAAAEEPPPKEQLFARLKKGLRRTREGFIEKVDTLIKGAKALDDDLFDELEEALVTADMGVQTSLKVLKNMQEKAARDALESPSQVKELLIGEITGILEGVQKPLDVEGNKPFVIMVLGVNGTGKTTTIGKLAAKYHDQGKKVILGAADTFRAAAAEQLEKWADRVGCEIVRHKSGADPGAVAFDTIKAALSRKADIVIVDTAGRLHTRVPLMQELKKVRRILGRECEGAPHEVMIVLDATTGQNAISQVETFKNELDITGITITKLDGTAKGGVIVGISEQFNLPIRFIGIGEAIDDLREFNAREFVEALF